MDEVQNIITLNVMQNPLEVIQTAVTNITIENINTSLEQSQFQKLF
jgi:hypothetical protein